MILLAKQQWISASTEMLHHFQSRLHFARVGRIFPYFREHGSGPLMLGNEELKKWIAHGVEGFLERIKPLIRIGILPINGGRRPQDSLANQSVEFGKRSNSHMI